MNQTIGKVDSDDKKMKIDKFNIKKTTLSTVQGDQFLYIDSQIGLQVQFLIATVFIFLSLDPSFLKGLLHYIFPFE